MEIAEYLTKYREWGRFSTWLVTIAHRRLADYCHRQWTYDLLVDMADEAQNLQLG